MASSTTIPLATPDPFDLGIHTPANLNRGARAGLLQNSPAAVNGTIGVSPGPRRMAQTPSSPLNAATIAAATEGAEGGEKEPCIYAKTRSHSQQIKEAEQILELFNLLRTGSENQAVDSLRILRSHNDVENFLDIIKARRSQEKRTRERERAPISTSKLGIEYELMTRNVVMFPPLQTIESNVLKLVILHKIQAFSEIQFERIAYMLSHGLQFQAYTLQGGLEHRSSINGLW
ncbi:hypothetical protein Forpi1262_v018194 [Fusarium oxysporum f. sp. raphani]|nr:hypothetical protein Forpi1262_v018194 [Fusarium oxysporum f. sp. raphani]